MHANELAAQERRGVPAVRDDQSTLGVRPVMAAAVVFMGWSF